MCVEEDERRRRDVKIDFKAPNCKNCGAPETGIKCKYCGTWFIDPKEFTRIEFLCADDRVIDMIVTGAEMEGKIWP